MYSRIRKQDEVDPQSRIENLLTRFEIQFARDFLNLVRRIKNNIVLSEVADLIEAGQIQQAIAAAQSEIIRFSDIVVSATITSGQDTADFLSNTLDVAISFDQTNTRAVNDIRNSRLGLITEISNAQRDATREALTEGIRQGVNPRQQAINLRDSIGLTQRQVQAVNNYRRLLERGSSQALNRELRDRRFDRTVRRAIQEGTILSQDQIDRMVNRYRERYLNYRAEVIARTESLRSVHQGNELMYRQAVDNGTLDINRIVRQWNTAEDARVRDTHNGMDEQQRGFGESFTSDAGVSLMYPGDPSAPAKETIQCRCAISTRLLPIGDIFRRI